MVCLTVFAIRQLRINRPLLELRIFAVRDFTVAVLLSMFLYAVLIAGLWDPRTRRRAAHETMLKVSG